ncbi:cytochrome p450 family protein [Colletotrichum truncatum]|uniref:Cytochrome p450 family protein n=1 Tax=Colletotrichum truncatum TaxID=5467 RepID=A0ACC3YFI9_COLTU|nr:cytochrome p450 family protein [Colletotrichum truncatum]KAF6788367.1 cytochrome p450 family protein [Colletotrichum truncatum]
MAFSLILSAPFLGAATVLFLTYIICLAVYRLYLSPLAKFPGPKLAAFSNWYEFYHDVVRPGKFATHIQSLHKQYGPIIRITPTELHIDDPSYFDTLYTRSGRRDKYDYVAGRFGFSTDSFSTSPHELHRIRRKALSPFFAAAKISDFESVIQAKVNNLCDKLAASADGQVVKLDRAFVALTTDVITQYAFGRSYNHLESPGFEETLYEAFRTIHSAGSVGQHFPFIFKILNALPIWFVKATQPDIMPLVTLRQSMRAQIGEIRQKANEKNTEADHANIFFEVINSDLPESEKSDTRLGDEAQLMIAAGLITTSWALAVATFHFATKPAISARLRKELDAAGSPTKWHELERLPYLNACVLESVRLSHGVVSRDPRLAPDAELTYGEWTIPINTPVSMTTLDVLMNEEVFPEPESFIPERWIEKPELQRYFVAFGKGSRQCLGINLALAELHITIATVFERFDFELFETEESDVQMAHAWLAPYPRLDSKGVRVKVTEHGLNK